MEDINPFLEAVRCDPLNAYAHYALGIRLLVLERYKEAIAAMENAASLDNNQDGIHLNLGAAYSHIGDFCTAITHYQKAIDLKPGWAAAYFNLGNALANEKRFPEAASAFSKAISLDPSGPCAPSPEFAIKMREWLDEQA